jgi:hypothetical protein
LEGSISRRQDLLRGLLGIHGLKLLAECLHSCPKATTAALILNVSGAKVLLGADINPFRKVGDTLSENEEIAINSVIAISVGLIFVIQSLRPAFGKTVNFLIDL